MTHPVGTKKANELGIHDMSGNVWEWVQDLYGSYSGSPQTNPQGPSTGSPHVIRGGGWDGDAWHVRVSFRTSAISDDRNRYIGFRLARGAE